MVKGSVKWFNDKKGYGFIQSEETNSDVFVHYSSIASDGYRTLTQGQAVEFDIEDGQKGAHAINVKIV